MSPTVVAMFSNLRTSPDSKRVLIADSKSSLSVGEFVTAVLEWAHTLRSQSGVQKGDRVAIYVPRGCDEAVLLFACWVSGFIAVPINARLRNAQVDHIVRDSGAQMIVTTADFLAQFEKRQSSDGLRALVVDFAQLPRIETDEFPLNGKLPRGDIGTSSSLSADDPAALLYTSGSTGSPKGIILTHRNLVEGAEVVSEFLGIVKSDVIASVLPFSFDYGLNQLLCAVSADSTLMIIDYVLPGDLIRLLQDRLVTVLALVPHLWNQLCDQTLRRNLQLPSLRIMTSSGGHMHEKTVQAMSEVGPNAAIFLMYGLTEAFRSCFLDPALALSKPGSVGKAVPGVEVVVLRPDGSECNVEEVGEVVHRGAFITRGYWRAPEATRVRFRIRSSFVDQIPISQLEVWSGDFGYKDRDGDLFIVGRADGIVKRSGFRINLSEVEAELLGEDTIRECAVVSLVDENLVTRLVAFISTTSDYDERNLLSALRERAPSHLIPDKIIALDHFPTTPSGKIDRKNLESTAQDVWA